MIQPVYVHSALKGGLMTYTRGWAWQQLILSRRLEYLRSGEESPNDDFHPDHDRILMIEHSPVYTLGSGSDDKHLTFLKGDEKSIHIKTRLSKTYRGLDSARLSVDRLKTSTPSTCTSLYEIVDCFQSPDSVTTPSGVPIYRVERGGQVTCHCPGMLVVYPLLDLRREPYKQDLHWYLRCIEEVIIRTLERYSIAGTRDEINSGVWVNENKIAAVGVSASRWFSTHGFAININPDLSFFDPSIIIPCGLIGRGVTSMAKELAVDPPSITHVAGTVVECFREVFGVSSILSKDIT